MMQEEAGDGNDNCNDNNEKRLEALHREGTLKKRKSIWERAPLILRTKLAQGQSATVWLLTAGK